MAVSEQQLETWSHQGATAQSASTYQSIRNVLNHPDSPYHKWSYEIFLQGSYGNDTNIYADSDVDIAICLTSVYYSDLHHLNDDEKARYEANRLVGKINFNEFRDLVLQWLRANFGQGVEAGKKAIFVPGHGNRRDADVLVCVENKEYFSYPANVSPSFATGICFWTSSKEKVVNYPKQHLQNCSDKHAATSQRLKPSIRTLKNMRNAMIDAGKLEDGLAPSYFLEGLLSNIPNQNFVSSRQQTFENYMSWLQSCNSDELTCANGIHYLLRNGHSVCWNKADYDKFRAAAYEFYVSN